MHLNFRISLRPTELDEPHREFREGVSVHITDSFKSLQNLQPTDAAIGWILGCRSL